jgi:hypothetical protein
MVTSKWRRLKVLLGLRGRLIPLEPFDWDADVARERPAVCICELDYSHVAVHLDHNAWRRVVGMLDLGAGFHGLGGATSHPPAGDSDSLCAIFCEMNATTVNVNFVVGVIITPRFDDAHAITTTAGHTTDDTMSHIRAGLGIATVKTIPAAVIGLACEVLFVLVAEHFVYSGMCCVAEI